MVRPSAASLNFLAGVLRQSQPLYDECRSILNRLECGEGRCGLRHLRRCLHRPTAFQLKKALIWDRERDYKSS